MALSNADNPIAEKPKPLKAPVPSQAAERSLGRASTSGDPAVHHLLAVRQAALSNEDVEAVKAADDELAALGFAV